MSAFYGIRVLFCTYDSLSEMTSEEITAKRRQERKQFKFDRAQAMAAAAAEAEAAFAEGRHVPSTVFVDGARAIPSAATWKPPQQSSSDENPSSFDGLVGEPDDELLKDVEHLQLTLQEAFFLLWNLDCLTVHDPHMVHIFSSTAPNEMVNSVLISCRTHR